MKPRQTRLSMPVGAPASGSFDDTASPFLRPKKRTRVHRRRGRFRRLTLLSRGLSVLLTLAFSAWWGLDTVLSSERLQVDRIDVRGSRFLSDGEVRELLRPAVGHNILTLDIESLLKRLQSSPWVARATVSRALPDRLQVEIEERVPLALAEVEQLYLMDAQGALIDLYGPRTATFDLPIVRGLANVDVDARRDRAERAGLLLEDLGELAHEVSEVEVEASGDLRIVLRQYGETLRMGPPPFREKFVTYLGLREELLERCPDAEYFDLRFRDRIYAKQTDDRPIQPVAVARGR